jgi:hypothetical protein
VPFRWPVASRPDCGKRELRALRPPEAVERRSIFVELDGLLVATTLITSRAWHAASLQKALRRRRAPAAAA